MTKISCWTRSCEFNKLDKCKKQNIHIGPEPGFVGMNSICKSYKVVGRK